ncbi:MAG: hypothetical protein ACKO9Q_03420, partial [Pirellula sp.]
MRLPRRCQGRKDAAIVQGLVLVMALLAGLSLTLTADAAAISKNFDKIQTNRKGIGFPFELQVENLIGNNFVDLGTLGGGLLPDHETVDAFNSWGVRID